MTESSSEAQDKKLRLGALVRGAAFLAESERRGIVCVAVLPGALVNCCHADKLYEPFAQQLREHLSDAKIRQPFLVPVLPWGHKDIYSLRASCGSLRSLGHTLSMALERLGTPNSLILVGHSVGGRVALQLFLQNPALARRHNVTAIVTINSPVRRHPEFLNTMERLVHGESNKLGQLDKAGLCALAEDLTLGVTPDELLGDYASCANPSPFVIVNLAREGDQIVPPAVAIMKSADRSHVVAGGERKKQADPHFDLTVDQFCQVITDLARRPNHRLGFFLRPVFWPECKLSVKIQMIFQCFSFK